MKVQAPFGFVTGCHAGDKFMVGATLASIRRYCPDVPICLTVDGDFDSFTVAPGNQELTGDVSAVFVPEPSSLAILGLGLFGLGFTARRKASAK